MESIPGEIERITDAIAKFTDKAVIGLSGGVDSLLVTLLCKEALGAENVYVLHMPYDNRDLSGSKFNARSLDIASNLGVKGEMIFIRETCDSLEDEFGHLKISELNSGNMRSRMRMVALYTYCCTLSEKFARDYSNQRVRVMGTGNLSEDFIGYDTKGGDALADFFPIGHLFKSEVYGMLEWFVERGDIEERHIDRVPSAGLWDGQTDEKELGYTYDEMEPVIRRFKETGEWEKSVVGAFVRKMHYANKHKHQAPPTIDDI